MFKKEVVNSYGNGTKRDDRVKWAVVSVDESFSDIGLERKGLERGSYSIASKVRSMYERVEGKWFWLWFLVVLFSFFFLGVAGSDVRTDETEKMVKEENLQHQRQRPYNNDMLKLMSNEDWFDEEASVSKRTKAKGPIGKWKVEMQATLAWKKGC